MRNMTPEEKEKLKRAYEEINKTLSAQKNRAFLTSLDMSNKMNIHFPYGVSPTDIEADGMYSYQEPEVDEQGTYYGYKILRRTDSECPCPECSSLRSPRYAAVWLNGELTSDFEPSKKSMYGIHFTKRPDHPELMRYAMGSNPILVKCALSGTIVETDQGWRAQHALIVGVLTGGRWISYEDYLYKK